MPPPAKAKAASVPAVTAPAEPVHEPVVAEAPAAPAEPPAELPAVEAGSGRFVFDDGSTYEGDYILTRADGLKKRHGLGRFVGMHYSYDGAWANDEFHGEGVFVSADGAQYTGSLDAGAFHGARGSYRFPDGATYEGAWFRNAMHGPGHYVSPDGVLFAGEFHHGLFVRGTTHVAVR